MMRPANFLMRHDVSICVVLHIVCKKHTSSLPVPLDNLYEGYLNEYHSKSYKTYVIQNVIQISRKSILGKYSRYISYVLL